MKYFVVLTIALFSQFSSAKITISGIVMDGKGKPVSKCDVFFNKQKWITDESVHVTCNQKGEYSAEIEPGLYNSMYVCDEDLYAKSKLEFWGWNLNLDKSEKIDVAFDTIEVYSLATWASNGGSNSIFASFRPMHLVNPTPQKRMQLTDKNFYVKEVEGKPLAIMDIAPKMTMESIKGSIDGKELDLLQYFWSYEKLDGCGSFPKNIDTKNGCYMPMIIAQFKKPKLKAGQHTLKVRVIDELTREIGEGITHFTSNESGYGF